MRYAELAGLQTVFDSNSREFVTSTNGKEVFRADLSSQDGQDRTTEFFTDLLDLGEHERPFFAEALPHRFTDVPVVSETMMNAVSLINLESVRELSERIGADIDERRFRGNVVFDGWPPFAELDLVGKTIQIGDVRLEVVMRTKKCAATEVNPDTAKRDIDLPKLLMQEYGHFDMGIYARVVSGGTLEVGTDIAAESLLLDETPKDDWQNFQVERMEDESAVIRSFYLKPEDKGELKPFEAGQFLTLRVTPEGEESPIIRTYTVSSAPHDDHYRISVKREDEGLVSRHLHDVIKSGDHIDIKAPRGSFYIDPKETRSAVLIAGGVGVTPMISMARHIAKSGNQDQRALTVLHSARDTTQRAFSADFSDLAAQQPKKLRYFSFIGNAADSELTGKDFHAIGYMTPDVLKQILPMDDYDFFLCGPPTFMQAIYDALRSLGARDARIKAEAFGPASLKRVADSGTSQREALNEAEKAVVKFTKSGTEHSWNTGEPTLLELAESTGLSPDYSCRSGVCGSCKVKVLSGTVAYRTEPIAEHESDEALICCSVPGEGSEKLELDL